MKKIMLVVVILLCLPFLNAKIYVLDSGRTGTVINYDNATFFYENITNNITTYVNTTINITNNITTYITNNITNNISYNYTETNNYFTNITNNITTYVNITNNITTYMNTTTNITYYVNTTNNITYYINTTNNITNDYGNASWNQSLASMLYYPLSSNPLGYYNFSTLPPAGNPFNQSLNTTDSVTFYGIDFNNYVSSSVTVGDILTTFSFGQTNMQVQEYNITSDSVVGRCLVDSGELRCDSDYGILFQMTNTTFQYNDQNICTDENGLCGYTFNAGKGMNLTNNFLGITYGILATTCGVGNYSYFNGSEFLCRADNSSSTTTYTAGNGLTLSGTQFNVSATTCALGNYSYYNGSTFLCGADNSSSSSGSGVSVGETFPTSPTNGQIHLINMTNRRYLYVYDGSTSVWSPIQSLGESTLYVDDVNGVDNVTQGNSATTGAFKTIQYAVDTVPPTFTGNVTINIAAGTYYGLVTLQGKAASGDYYITLDGDLTNVTGSFTATATTAGTGDGEASWMNLTSSGMSSTAYRRKLLVFTNGTYNNTDWLVLDNTATQIRLVGKNDTAIVSAGSAFKIYDHTTVISGATVGAPTTPARQVCIRITGGQKNIIIKHIYLKHCVVTGGFGDHGAILADNQASFILQSVKITDVINGNPIYLKSNAVGKFYTLLSENNVYHLRAESGSTVTAFERSLLYNSTSWSITEFGAGIYNFNNNYVGQAGAWSILPTQNSVFVMGYSNDINSATVYRGNTRTSAYAAIYVISGATYHINGVGNAVSHVDTAFQAAGGGIIWSTAVTFVNVITQRTPTTMLAGGTQ